MKLRVRPIRRREGSVTVPGDKSIFHRAALLGALASGTTEVTGFLEAEDCLGAMTAVEALSVEVSRQGPGQFRIAGAGLGGLREPDNAIDCGNSGTTARIGGAAGGTVRGLPGLRHRARALPRSHRADAAPALAVAGLIAAGETVIEGAACVATSFPSFAETVNRLAGETAITVDE